MKSLTHFIPVQPVIERYPHIDNFKPVKYVEPMSTVKYFMVADIAALITVEQYRQLMSDVSSVLVTESNEFVTNDSINYEIKFNFCGWRPGDVVGETELVARMNNMNKPDGGPKPLSYYLNNFPEMLGSIFVRTAKPKKINL